MLEPELCDPAVELHLAHAARALHLLDGPLRVPELHLEPRGGGGGFVLRQARAHRAVHRRRRRRARRRGGHGRGEAREVVESAVRAVTAVTALVPERNDGRVVRGKHPVELGELGELGG